MNIEKLRGIFVEEAREIIAKLENDIIDLEHSPADGGLVNELFRGVHTLKGSAQSFGFEHLGRFAHIFEDLLDRYRGRKLQVSQEGIEVCLRGIDLLKELLERGIAADDSLPEGYENVQNAILSLLGHEEPPVRPPSVSANDLAREFAAVPAFPEAARVDTEAILSGLKPGEGLYKISVTLPLENLSYGYDRVTEALNAMGTLHHSEWDLRGLPPLERFDPERNYIPGVTYYLHTATPLKAVSASLSFLGEREYSIVPIIHTEENASAGEGRHGEKTATALPSGQIRIDTEKLDLLFDTIGELVIAQNFLIENESLRLLENEAITRSLESLSKITRRLQNQVMTLRMVPVQATFEKMKRVVHDAGKGVNKSVELLLEGVDTEIDKTMIDALSDPLVHMVRNAIDHGLESADGRRAAGKSDQGIVTLKAYHRGGSVVIEVSDDGRGIDSKAVRERALEHGLIDKNTVLSDEELYGLLLMPGFSTATEVSELSGRGVGLDVVRTALARLQGRIEIRSTVGKGSTFALILPLTLAIIDGMIVHNAGALYVVPTLAVRETFTAGPGSIHTVYGKGRFVDLRGSMIPVVSLSELLGNGEESALPDDHPPTYLLVSSKDGEYAIEVDEIINRQQVVIKPLGHPLDTLREISGGAILGSGEIALILNVENLYGAGK